MQYNLSNDHYQAELTVLPAGLAVSTVACLLAAMEATLKLLTTHKLTHMLRVLQ